MAMDNYPRRLFRVRTASFFSDGSMVRSRLRETMSTVVAMTPMTSRLRNTSWTTYRDSGTGCVWSSHRSKKSRLHKRYGTFLGASIRSCRLTAHLQCWYRSTTERWSCGSTVSKRIRRLSVSYVQDGRTPDLLYATGFAKCALSQFKQFGSLLDAETRLRIGNLLGELQSQLNAPSPDPFLVDQATESLKLRWSRWMRSR